MGTSARKRGVSRAVSRFEKLLRRFVLSTWNAAPKIHEERGASSLIQFGPVDLVSFLPVTLERSRGRDFDVGIAVLGQRNAHLRLNIAAAGEI